MNEARRGGGGKIVPANWEILSRSAPLGILYLCNTYDLDDTMGVISVILPSTCP